MSWLLANSAVAALLAVVVLLLGRFARPAPAVMHALWLFVLLKLVTPPLFEVPLDLGWSATPTAQAVVPIELRDLLALADGVVVPDAADGPANAAPMPAPSAVDWQAIVVWLWATGAVAMACWYAIGLWRGARRLRRMAPVSPRLRHEIEDMAARLGVPVPLLRDDPAAGSPYLWTFGRTSLVVPQQQLAAASAKGRAAVLAHELAHLRRGDHWLAHGELLLAVLLWWHPLFWFARARLRLWAELAADAWALASVPDAQLDYATALVDAVARPDSAAPAAAVLAVRPAVRSAFERRLTMILNENVPCRASAAWWLPFTTLALGLFAVPTAAQRPPQEPARVEIRVNGKQVDDLSGAERKALLRELLRAEEQREAEPAQVQEEQPAPPARRPKAQRSGKQKQAAGDDKVEQQRRRGVPMPRNAAPDELAIEPSMPSEAEMRAMIEGGLAEMPSGAELRAMIEGGLAEARIEIEGDEDLRELGITDEVLGLLESVQSGEGLEESLDPLIKAAMRGAGQLVEKELRADPDLRELGLGDGLGKLVLGFLGDRRNQEMISDFVAKAMRQAAGEVKRELRADPELRELGIGAEVEGLIDSLLRGGDIDGQLQGLIEKAMQGASRKVRIELEESEGSSEPEPQLEEQVVEPPPAETKAKRGKRRGAGR
jgi:beta-lactamase regulating signal transducer with metallopeptidase domain/DNA-binding protein YbaB